MPAYFERLTGCKLIKNPINYKVMKTKKQLLIDELFSYSNSGDLMECYFAEHLNKFCIVFNARLIATFKTLRAFEHKRDALINKYSLIAV